MMIKVKSQKMGQDEQEAEAVLEETNKRALPDHWNEMNRNERKRAFDF